VPILGKIFKKAFFSRIAGVYDILVNFIESHKKAQKLLRSVINDNDFVHHIILEGSEMVKGAEIYNKQNIEEVFPEVCQAIQSRTV